MFIRTFYPSNCLSDHSAYSPTSLCLSEHSTHIPTHSVYQNILPINFFIRPFCIQPHLIVFIRTFYTYSHSVFIRPFYTYSHSVFIKTFYTHSNLVVCIRTFYIVSSHSVYQNIPIFVFMQICLCECSMYIRSQTQSYLCLILVYSVFGLDRILVYSVFSLDRILVYSVFSLDRILIYTKFVLDRILVYSVFGLDRILVAY